MYDAVNVFANSVGSFEGPSDSMKSANISCKSSNRWANGTFLYDRLNAVGIIYFYLNFHKIKYYNIYYNNNIIFDPMSS